jgi:hypothetical protein
MLEKPEWCYLERTDNAETQATLGIIHRTATNEAKHTAQNI